jgi:hypothetical protein
MRRKHIDDLRAFSASSPHRASLYSKNLLAPSRARPEMNSDRARSRASQSPHFAYTFSHSSHVPHWFEFFTVSVAVRAEAPPISC